MKKHFSAIKRISAVYLIPVYFMASILLISTVFANMTKNEEAIPSDAQVSESKPSENKESRNIKVYFHEKDEVREVPLEEHLVGVVCAEMPPSFEMEALKAQAVAARTFIINRDNAQNAQSIEEHKGGSVCTNSQHCKAYVDEEQARKNWGNDWNDKYRERIQEAVNDTHGLIVTYNNEPISAVFHSTSSGKTENSEDVWGSPLPYLRSVESEGEELSPRYSSENEFSIDEFKNILSSLNENVSFAGENKNLVGGVEYTESGSVKTITIGGAAFKGTDMRTAFGLRSTNFRLEINDKAVFHVTGNGHGVGMSQYGANYAAQNGSTYKQILAKYYQGTDISNAY